MSSDRQHAGPVAERSVAVQRSAWWLAGTVLVTAVIAILALFHQTAASIVAVWRNSETFSHGFVIIPIVLGLIWYRRHALMSTQPRPWPWALTGVALAGLAWLVGAAGDVSGIQHFALAAMIPFTVWAVLGHAATRTLVFPLGYLFFAVPFGAFLIQPLMIVTADMTVGLVRASGVPVYREAMEFTLPTGSWSVIEACSGVRYLIAAVVLGVLYAYLVYRSIWRRLVFIGLSVAVPIIANGLRAYMIVMIGHHGGMEYAAGADHLLYGWVFFGIVIFLLFWIGSWWREDRPSSGGRANPSTDGVPGATATSAAPGGSRRLVGTGLVAVLIALGWPVYAGYIVRADSGGVPELAAPVFGGGWQPVATPTDDWRPDYHDPRAELSQYYAGEGPRLGLYVGYYKDQLEHAEMLAWGHAIAPSGGSGWRQLGIRDGPVAGSGSVRPAEAVLGRNRERMLAWRWYWVDGRWTASRIEVKARVTLARLLNRGDDTAVVVIHAPFDHSPEEVRAHLRDFSDRTLPALRAMLADRAG